MNEILRNIFQTLSENAEKNFITNKNAEDYIAEDGLWHCGKCGTPKQFRLPEQLVKMGMPEIVSSFCACQSAKEKREKAENQLSSIIHHNKEFAHIPEHYLSADINAVELPDARKIGTNYIQNFEKMGRRTATGKNIWSKGEVQRILKNEKYVGDALLQKSFTVDCITHKVVKNNGERPMYLVTDHHTPIVDRDTFNRVQQELARRTSKRKISDKTKTEQGKYSGKYALSELLICGHCGTPYRRRIWSRNGKKQVVWRCISRLEHGKKYCPDSPTIKEEQLHKAIIRAINNYYSCRNDIVRILKANIGTVLECQGQEDILAAEKRLREIDQARNDLVGLIASGGCDEDKLDSEFAKLYSEEQQLNERLENLKLQNKTSEETQAKLDEIMDMIEHEKFELETFDNVLIRKLIECIKVLSKTEILVIFKGGYEVRTEIE